jgi:hypothetical protein
LQYRRRHFYNSEKSGIVYCSSSYELKAATILDGDSEVVFYQTQLGFTNKDNQRRFVDFLVHYKNGTKEIIEIKPKRRVEEFKDQIEDNRLYAFSNGWSFRVWTENELGFKTEQEARNWADEFLSKLYKEDYVAIRKERSLIRTKRHYLKAIATDKITFYCEYCKEEHTQLRLTYEKNVAKNGRFICIKENGHIVGSQPKKKKEDPLAVKGLKQCKGPCGEIKPIGEFSKGKNVCKPCRNDIYKQKYNEGKNND